MITERSREIPWLLNNAIGARNLLDIGSAGNKYLDALSQVAHSVTAIDTRPFKPPYRVKGYLLDAADMSDEWAGIFDVVTCLSVLDHVGLNAYGQVEDETAMGRIVNKIGLVTTVNGRLLITAPVGRPQLTTHPNGGQRVFGVYEIPALFSEGWELTSNSYWLRNGAEYVEVDAADPELNQADYGGMFALACGAWEFVKHD